MPFEVLPVALVAQQHFVEETRAAAEVADDLGGADIQQTDLLQRELSSRFGGRGRSAHARSARQETVVAESPPAISGVTALTWSG